MKTRLIGAVHVDVNVFVCEVMEHLAILSDISWAWNLFDRSGHSAWPFVLL